MNKKKVGESKKQKISVSINDDLIPLMDERLENLNTNRSRYIEDLIRKDFENRGLNINPNFEK